MSIRRATARLFSLMVLVVAGTLALPALAQDESGRAPIPAYTGHVNDAAGVIGEPRGAELEAFLDQLHKKTGVQFAVLTVTSSAPEDPTAYKTRVFKEWGIGDRERDDGLLLVIAMQERAVRFETGYGLEGTLPDGWQSRMIRDLVTPRFRSGEPAEGITAAVLACAQRIGAEKGVMLEWNGKELRYSGKRSGRNRGILFLGLMFVLVFLVLPAIIPRDYRRRRGWYSSGGGGWSGGFGGFGGGFGGGGGGGGSSFGGFGGGSSGGGGGGGGW